MDDLSFFRIAYNPLVAWSIPSDISAVMPNLDTLLINVAAVTGSIPSEIAQLSHLRKNSVAFVVTDCVTNNLLAPESLISVVAPHLDVSTIALKIL